MRLVISIHDGNDCDNMNQSYNMNSNDDDDDDTGMAPSHILPYG